MLEEKAQTNDTDTIDEIVVSTETHSTLIGSFFLNFKFWKHYASNEAFKENEFHKISIEILEVEKIKKWIEEKFLSLEINSEVTTEVLMLNEKDGKFFVDCQIFQMYVIDGCTIEDLFINEQQAEDALKFWKTTVLTILSH